jgi:hypothetical protein
MNTKNFLPITLILLMGFFQATLAQKIQLGAGGTYGFENQIEKQSLGFQLSVIYKAQERIAILSTFGQIKETNKFPDFKYVSSEPYSFDDLSSTKGNLFPGDFSVQWLELTPVFYLFENSSKSISMSAGAGFGLYFAENNWNWNTYSSIHASRVEYGLDYTEDKMEPNLGYNVRSAVNIFVNSKTYFCLEAKYVLYKPSIQYEIGRPDSQDTYYGDRKINLNTLFMTISCMVLL